MQYASVQTYGHVFSYNITFHLADAFIQSDLQ